MVASQQITVPPEVLARVVTRRGGDKMSSFLLDLAPFAVAQARQAC
jgi:hypothetical protein